MPPLLFGNRFLRQLYYRDTKLLLFDMVEGNELDLHMTEIKTEYMDKGYDQKSEITFDETPVPIDFTVLKSEFQEETHKLDNVEKEFKLEVTAEEDEVFAEGFEVRPSCVSITEDECLKAGKEAFKCDVCEKWFFDPTRLKSNAVLHTRKTSFICDVCENDCLHFDHLKKHAPEHTGEKTLSSDLYEKTFCKSTDVERHSRVHTDENPCDCDMCGKKLSQSGTLNKDALEDIEEKPFSSDKCGKKFSQSRSVKYHALTHTQGRKQSVVIYVEENFGTILA
ncbi:zinc finger protein 623-like isoform X3 [Periplaneta americana]|uniref:zinc finger protein 623-like isoform X3 n=1 Tax=Periplaneta americana TaxID=6978 RepID=UPI0037E7E68C